MADKDPAPNVLNRLAASNPLARLITQRLTTNVTTRAQAAAAAAREQADAFLPSAPPVPEPLNPEIVVTSTTEREKTPSLSHEPLDMQNVGQSLPSSGRASTLSEEVAQATQGLSHEMNQSAELPQRTPSPRSGRQSQRTPPALRSALKNKRARSSLDNHSAHSPFAELNRLHSEPPPMHRPQAVGPPHLQLMESYMKPHAAAARLLLQGSEVRTQFGKEKCENIR